VKAAEEAGFVDFKWEHIMMDKKVHGEEKMILEKWLKKPSITVFTARKPM
jgi:hypothetical protein